MPKKNNSQEYWAKRRQQDKIKVIREGEKGIDNLKRLLKTNLVDVQVKIKNFYEKYGENPAEKMGYSEWQKYKAKLKRMAQQNPQDEFLQRLAKQNIPKYQIDRLRALELDLQMQLTEATNGQAQGIYNTLDDVARVSQSVLAKSMQASIGLKFNAIADRKLKQLLSSDWSGANWSDRLWHDRAVVGKKVTEILQKGVTQGTSLQKMARELKQTTNQSFNNAFRLIRTETSHIDGQVTLEGYKQAGAELGLEYYEYDAFLDSRTSTICRDLDKKRFKVSDAEVGINYPPMHPNCRSTTQLVLDEDYKKEEIEAEQNKTAKQLKEFREIESKAQNDILNFNPIQIQDKIKQIGEFSKVDLSELPQDVLQGVYITCEKIFSKYPQLKGGAGLITKNISADVYADNLSLITSITLNKQFYKDLKLLRNAYKKDLDLGFHPINTTENALLAHELGHSLRKYIGMKYDISASDIKKECLKRINYKANQVKEKLSEYATKNTEEFFAEAFSEYVDSPKPRKIAKALGEYINEILARKPIN